MIVYRDQANRAFRERMKPMQSVGCIPRESVNADYQDRINLGIPSFEESRYPSAARTIRELPRARHGPVFDDL
jgi:hypothetical protein